MKKIFLLLLLALVSLPLQAQQRQAAQREQMKKLDFLVGQWKGEGWIITPAGKRETFTQTEIVQKKIGGLALLVEGKGTSKLPSGEEFTAFEAAALITWDDQKGNYRFFSATSEGGAGLSEGRFVDGGAWEWGFKTPQGRRIRYTIKLTDKGEWHETGESSTDEKTWRQFHEMTLKKVN